MLSTHKNTRGRSLHRTKGEMDEKFRRIHRQKVQAPSRKNHKRVEDGPQSLSHRLTCSSSKSTLKMVSTLKGMFEKKHESYRCNEKMLVQKNYDSNCKYKQAKRSGSNPYQKNTRSVARWYNLSLSKPVHK